MATRTPPPASHEVAESYAPPGGLTRARALARVLDDLVRIPGTRIGIGIDPIIGLLPGVGDMIGGALSGYIILVAAQEGAPTSVLMRMLGNVALDSLVGSVPLLGDLFDVGVKSNRRNVGLLERYLESPRQTRAASRGVVALVLLAVALLVAAMVTLGVLLARWILRALG